VRPKYLLFAVLGLMALFVLWNNERFFLNPQAPEWAHYDPIRWHLLPHGIGGSLAPAFGALQFSTRLRRRYLHLHRLSGRLYIAGTFIAARRDLDGLREQPVVSHSVYDRPGQHVDAVHTRGLPVHSA